MLYAPTQREEKKKKSSRLELVYQLMSGSAVFGTPMPIEL